MPSVRNGSQSTAATARELLDGRTVLNVNSTATGGGVAEMLQTLLAYARGAGIDTRWVVIQGNPRFFEITKRLHNHLYGTAGDGGPLGDAEQRGLRGDAPRQRRGTPRRSSGPATSSCCTTRNPQAWPRQWQRTGAHVVWRCHVGLDTQNEHSDRGWEFLRPYVEPADSHVFSREQFAPTWVPRERLAVIAPSIDPFSAKNETINRTDVIRILQYVGLLAADGGELEPRLHAP